MLLYVLTVWVIGFIYCYFDNKVLFKLVLGGVIMSRVNSTVSAIFSIFGIFLASKDYNYSKPIFLTYETEFVLFLTVLENSVSPMG